MTTFPDADFEQNPMPAMKAAEHGPVFITDRGKPTHVLLNIEDYQRLKGERPKIADLLAMPGGEDVEFDPPRMVIVIAPADLS